MKTARIVANDNTESLTPSMLAKRFNLKSKGTLANWRVIGKGPKFIPGRPIRYPLREVEKWEAGQLSGSTAHSKTLMIRSEAVRGRRVKGLRPLESDLISAIQLVIDMSRASILGFEHPTTLIESIIKDFEKNGRVGIDILLD